MPRDDLEWLTFSDFTPGIQQRLQNPGNEAGTGFTPNPGVASVENTYRCIALPGGGLGPLPKQDFTWDRTGLNPTGTLHDDNYYILGFRVIGAVADRDVSAVTADYKQPQFPRYHPLSGDSHYVAFELAYGWFRDNSGTDEVVMEVEEIQRPNDASEATFTIYDEDTDAGDQNPNSSSEGIGDPLPLWTPVEIQYTRSVGDTSVSGARESTDIGSPVLVFSGQPWVDFTFMWPNPSTSALLEAGAFLDLNTAGFGGQGISVVAHQQRLVYLEHAGFNWPHNKQLQATDPMRWSKPNEVGGDALADGESFVNNDPVGYGVIASLSASDLVLIQHRSGGYLIQGDLNNPTVRRLSGLTSTGGLRTFGAATSIGFVYGVLNGGVWIWAGGDQSELLSPQLEPDFFLFDTSSPSQNGFLDFGGKFAQWGEYILCPNNFMFDTKTQGWWRIENPSTTRILQWETSPSGPWVYGVPATFPHDASTAQTVVYGWRKDERATSYSWQSHPLFPLQTRYVTPRTVRVLAQGTGTITLTINDDTNNQITLSVADDDHAVFLRKNIPGDVASDRIRLRIESSGSASGPAPVVYSCDIGYRPSRTKELAN